ncbi:MAG: ATP-grasp domain-containing protein [Syntrophobacteraceae bacterium]
MRPFCVSFRPEVEMEENLPPLAALEDPRTIELLRKAAGVLLPSHVSPWRYEGITVHARDWFPRLDVQFHCRGKTRQVHLFDRMGVRRPETLVFQTPAELGDYLSRCGSPWGYPFVLKGDLGGGGDTVFPIYEAQETAEYLEKLPRDAPLLIQKWVGHGGKDLRVVIYGDQAVSYFRVGGGRFYNNVCRGGKVDHEGWPELQQKGVEAALAFSRNAAIDIAGFDLMFPDDGAPVFIEVNFHFGRKGLGGRSAHERYVSMAIERWRNRLLTGRDGVRPAGDSKGALEGENR